VQQLCCETAGVGHTDNLFLVGIRLQHCTCCFKHTLCEPECRVQPALSDCASEGVQSKQTYMLCLQHHSLLGCLRPAAACPLQVVKRVRALRHGQVSQLHQLHATGTNNKHLNGAYEPMRFFCARYRKLSPICGFHRCLCVSCELVGGSKIGSSSCTHGLCSLK
jgi:hypothetical protein